MAFRYETDGGRMKRTYEDFKKSRMHQVYKQKSGKVVPGATTIISNCSWGQRFLDMWQKKMFEQGIDPVSAMRTAGEIGTITHYLIECHLKEEEPETGEFGQDFLNIATSNLEGFKKWQKATQFEAAMIEKQIVSEEYSFGGTIDLFGNVLGESLLLDIKTSKGVYPKHEMQIIAYQQLLFEYTGEKYPCCFLHVRNGRTVPIYVDKSRETQLWRAFQACLVLDEARRKLGA